jgi:SAM-dependent methyltransferase
MPSQIKDHYDQLLADHYEWMFGASFEAKVEEQRGLLEDLAGPSPSNSLAIDLGCGPGYQSFALNDLGYRVLGVDLSEKLIAAFAQRIGRRNITPKLGDLMDIGKLAAPASAALVVCMGDTLTHLSSKNQTAALFKEVSRVLAPGGRFIATWRDLAAAELKGLDRFIPVRSDNERVMVCCLDYETDTVVVNDLVHTRQPSGAWTLNKSAYRKLRLSQSWVRDAVSNAGLAVQTERGGRVSLLSAIKMA